MRRRRFLVLAAGAAAVAGCAARPARERPLVGRVSIVASTAAGGSWEAVARVLSWALRREGLVRDVDIDYRHGAPAAVATAALGGDRAGATPIGPATPTHRAGARWLITGVPMLAAAEMDDSGEILSRATPIARLVGEREVLVVPAVSRLRDFEGFAAELRRDAEGPLVAGGPLGGAEHVLFGMIAQGLGVDARRVQYAGYGGPDAVASAVLGGRAAAGIGPVHQWERRLGSGDARALAVSSAARVEGVDAPSLLECGVRVDYADWCGLLGPGGMSDDERALAVEVCDRLGDSPYWREACRGREWISHHLSGDGFAQWLGGETIRMRAALRDLGLLNRPDVIHANTNCWGDCVDHQ
ncbi:tripartite tricarboxylate transporter substrate-binding protein [Spongiactinospora sp. TRM90649]|uniref:tripartite tricarboxylate transporter substrate-binding protein n=1 Tax=Spongiactinospora sp. TRM90649 TaxID=3031114 RepID=UPI0023F9A2ED|nr:tripartite tricarboxylate transporter substrate-binding protein [Spongiactinospora sp. TRM90649]MDF5752221.1 tripartite tricarboxylate transporter substrate-binding protein [Spongiactinospora sp. TRM90649]